MKKIVKGLLVFGLMLVLGACGSGNANNHSSTKKQQITFWGSWSGDQVAQLNKLIEKYNQSQDKYTVKYKVQDNGLIAISNA